MSRKNRSYFTGSKRKGMYLFPSNKRWLGDGKAFHELGCGTRNRYLTTIMSSQRSLRQKEGGGVLGSLQHKMTRGVFSAIIRGVLGESNGVGGLGGGGGGGGGGCLTARGS